MEIKILDRKLKKIITDSKKLRREYGVKNAEKIIQRYNELKNIPNMGLMIRYKIGRCHQLKGNLKGKYALDLEHPFRLIIEPIFDDENNTELQNVVSISIIKMEDYHG